MSGTAYLDTDQAPRVAHGVELIASQFISACDVQQVIAADGDLVELLLHGAGVARAITLADIKSAVAHATRSGSDAGQASTTVCSRRLPRSAPDERGST